MTGAELASLFPRHGFDFFAGVPRSVISDVIAALGRRPRAPWVAAVREDAAVGLAAGRGSRGAAYGGGGPRPAIDFTEDRLETSRCPVGR